MAERITRVIVTALLIFGYTADWAAAENPAAARDIARGHALLTAARLEAAGEERETLLAEAVEAFKSSYRWFGRDTQVRALLGAAQGYLMMQTPRRVFPFLWQATPLQRAERTAQQALVMQPDNPAAAFLLALIYWRQAMVDKDPAAALALGNQYAVKAADLGMPVAVPGAAGRRSAARIRDGGCVPAVAVRGRPRHGTACRFALCVWQGRQPVCQRRRGDGQGVPAVGGSDERNGGERIHRCQRRTADARRTANRYSCAAQRSPDYRVFRVERRRVRVF